NLYGATTTITNAVTFSTSGALYLGNESTDTLTFTNGLIATAPSAISLGGTINTNSAAVLLGASDKTVTLVVNSVINTYANNAAGANITINGPVQGTNVGLEDLTLKAKGGTITITGSVGSSKRVGTLTLGDANQTAAIVVNGTIDAQALTVGQNSGSNAFGITLYNMGTSLAAAAGTTNVTNAATFYNTGAIQLGDYALDIFNFLGGLSIASSSGVTIKAQSLNATASPIYINVPTRFSYSTSLSPTTGRITLGAATLDDGVTLVLGAGAVTPMTLSSISGTAGNAKSNITFNTTGAITVSGAIGTDIGTFTITNSGGIAFNGTVGASGDRITTVSIANGSGTISFNDNLYAGSLSNTAGTTDIKFYGSTTDVTSAVTLSTTGDVYFGDASSDVLTFSRGITHSTGNNILLGTFTAGNPTQCVSGVDCSFNMGGTTSFLSSTSTFDFGTSSMTLNNVILGDGVTLYLGGGHSGAITVASISGTLGGAKSNVVINNTGTVSITGAIGTDIGSLTLTNSGGATFGSTVDANTSVVISATTGTVTFNGALTTPTLSVATGVYNLGLNATGTAVTDGVTFSNTGTLALGSLGGTQTYTGGITAIAPSASTLKGTINTTDNAMSFGPVTLGSATVLKTNASTSTSGITLGAVTGSLYNLTLSTGSTSAGASVTGTSFSGTGTLAFENIGGTARFTGGITASSLTVASTVNNVALVGSTGSITNAVTFANTGSLTLGASGGSQTYTGGITATAPSGITLAGTYILGASSYIGDADTAITLAAPTILSVSTSGTLSVDGNVVATNIALTITGAGNTTISTPIEIGSGALTKSSTGSLTLSASSGFSGTTLINGGTLSLTGSGTIASSSKLTNNAIFDISGTTSGASIISLAGNSAGSVVLGSKTLTITSAADTFAGVISGNTGSGGNLILFGGTQLLTGNNTYTGTTTINSGATLQIGNATTTGSLGSGAVTNNGSLIFNRSNDITIA
ncbi:beta strand repeat-containing protein, partial [Polynucleobacter nymphae]|uniref:beta strand repeat-containing protein n=1 Tax=Polynucleobacter nymphae TaxID=2081043 RepID=UPI0034E27D34|nr:hypothetical protein [Polynucleobacter nymphae]